MKFMKNVKRVITAALSAAMVLSLAAGCGSGGNTAKNDVTKVTVWRTNGHDKEFVQRKIKEFNDTIGKEKGVEVEYIAKEGDLDQLVDVAFQSGQAPDLFTTFQLQARVEKGQLAPYNDIEGCEEIIKKYGKYAVEQRHSYDGKIYILPTSSCTYGLVYNKEMFKAAGIVDDLPYPSEIIDVPVLAAIFWQHKGCSELLSKGFPRSQSEILDAADITLRYDWACVEARIHGKEAPASLNGGVVMERHYAFNWIIGANGGAGWDDIQPNT